MIVIAINRLKLNEDGLSLVELLITFAVLGFIIAALYSFYLTGLRSWNRSIEQMEYQQTTRIAMNKIIKELQNAHKIKYDVENDSYAIDAPSEIIYFRINVEGQSTRHSFRLNGSQLHFDRRRDNDNSIRSSNVVALNMTGLVFVIDEHETVFITVKAGDDFQEIGLTGAVRPRRIP